MPLSWDMFQVMRRENRSLLAAGRAPAGVEICRSCETPLQESRTGCYQCADGSHVCNRCYYRALGEEIDNHPVGAARPVRGS